MLARLITLLVVALLAAAAPWSARATNLDDALGGGWAALAIDEIRRTYGDEVSIDEKDKTLLKFGRTANADTDQPTTVMTLPGATQYFETYETTDSINRIVSSNDADEGLALIEGHTIDSDGNFTFVVQTVALDGQTPAVLTTPLARATRVANIGSTNWAGTVSVYENGTVSSGVPQTAADVHIQVAAGRQQSEKAATAFSEDDYALITGIYASVARGNSAVNCDINFEVRNKGGVFREQIGFTLRSDGASSKVIGVYPLNIRSSGHDQ